MQAAQEETDVVVVGGSIAGATAATLLGHAGARVTLVEKAPDPQHHKRMCTHFIQAGGMPVLRRLGVLDELMSLGAVPNRSHVWSQYGWVHMCGEDGINIRRTKLDPVLRAAAGATDGVEVRQGLAATGIMRDASGRPAGVWVRATSGEETEIRARLVVGADGRGSGVARMAGVRGRVLPHERIGYSAYYEGVGLPFGSESVLWYHDKGVVLAFPNDDGLTLVGGFVPRDRLADFKADREGALQRSFEGLPDAPDFTSATRVDAVIGMLDMPNVRRRAAVPGLAFVGDAAQASDPLWGVGCGYALQSSEWLADAVGPALGSGSSSEELDAALDRYRRHHARFLLGHHLMTSDYSRVREFNPIERMFFSTGTHHRPTTEMLAELGARSHPIHRTLTPPRLARTALAAARHALAALASAT